MQNISIQRLQEIQQEREEVVLSKAFQDWAKSLNVGRLYVSKDGIHNAREMNSNYDFNKINWIGRKK